MKKLIIAIGIVASIVSCKKKKTDISEIPYPEEIVKPRSGCQATHIIETTGSSVVNVSISYHNAFGTPSKIVVDSGNNSKVSLLLDQKGRILSGNIPLSVSGVPAVVEFTSVNTEVNGVVIKSVKTANKITAFGVPVFGASASITDDYEYDNSNNLVVLKRTINANIPLAANGNVNMRDSVVYGGYINGRPTISSHFSRDLKEGTPYNKEYDENFEYDENGNRTKLLVNNVLVEETMFSTEVYPAKVSYLLNQYGNPNYGNLDQDKNFMQTSRTFKNCNGVTVMNSSTVTDFSKTGNCISKATLSDTTNSCSGGQSVGVKTYVVTY